MLDILLLIFWVTNDIQFSLFAQSCPTICDPRDCSMPGFPVHHQLLEFAQIHVYQVSDAIQLILCCPLLLPLSNFPSIRVFPNGSVLHIRWPKNWNSFSISPSNEYSGLISFRMDWFHLAVKGLSRVFCNSTVQKHQFLGAQLSLWSNSHTHTWLLEKP